MVSALAPLDIPNSRMKLSPESQAKVIHLLFTDGLSVELVARRFNVGQSTIRRIRAAYVENSDQRKAGRLEPINGNERKGISGFRHSDR